MVAERAYEYNGLTMGAGTSIGVVNVEGLYDADMRGSEVSRGLDHGSFINAPFAGSKRPIFEGQLHAEDVEDFAAMVSQMRLATNPQNVIRALNFRLPGETERLIYCLPKRRSIPVTIEYVQSNLAKWALEFVAGDPRVYSLVEEQLEINALLPGIAVNEGEFTTPPVMTVSGPSNNPKVIHESGAFVQVNINLGEGDELVIDVPQRTLKVNGVSVYGDRNLANEWFGFVPGDNELTFEGGLGTVDVRWRHAWL